MRGWYKDTTRMEEIKTLLQGFQIPPPPPVSADEPLPAARVCPSSPPNAQEPFSFSEPLDTTGKAKVRSRTSSPMQLPSSAALSSSTSSPEVSVVPGTTSVKSFKNGGRERQRQKGERKSKRCRGSTPVACIQNQWLQRDIPNFEGGDIVPTHRFKYQGSSDCEREKLRQTQTNQILPNVFV